MDEETTYGNNGSLRTTNETNYTQEELSNEFYKLKFGINLSIRYHLHRKSFFSSWHYFIMSVTSILGASSFMLLYAGDDVISKKIALITSAIVGLFTMLDAVFGFMRKYSIHDELQRKFIDLLNEIEMSNETEENLKTSILKRNIIQKEEPKDLHALYILCYNQECMALGNKDNIFKTDWRILFRHYWSFENWNPEKMNPSN